MPFTFSHPAAVIPLAKTRGLVFSALVIGSMTPDFESFLHLSTDVSFAHSLAGIGVFCLPSGILMFLLFHLFLKAPLLSLAPGAHQLKLFPLMRDMPLNSLRHWCVILCSLALGAITHVLWDAATHEYGWLVRQIPMLQGTVLHIGETSVTVYTALQHGGTFAGGVLVLLSYWRWYQTAIPADAARGILYFSNMQKLGITAAIIFSGGGCGLMYAVMRFSTGHAGARLLKDTVLLGIPLMLLGAIVFSGYYLAVKSRRTAPENSCHPGGKQDHSSSRRLST